jgi:hypothetical protein
MAENQLDCFREEYKPLIDMSNAVKEGGKEFLANKGGNIIYRVKGKDGKVSEIGGDQMLKMYSQLVTDNNLSIGLGEMDIKRAEDIIEGIEALYESKKEAIRKLNQAIRQSKTSL